MGLLKILFIITIVVFFPLGEIWRLNLTNGLSLRPLDLGVGVLVILWLLLHLFRGKKISNQQILFPVLIFSGISAISLLVNSQFLAPKEFLISSLYLARWMSYAGLYFVVRDFDFKFNKNIVRWMLIGGAIIVFAGYLQYFFYQNLRNLYYLGWDEHMYRMFSSFLDPNFAGTFFVLYFILVVGLLFQLRGRGNKKAFIVLIILALLTLMAVYLTYSRSALLMFIISSSILFILINKKWLMVGIIGISLVVFAIFSRNFYIENLNLLRIASSEARIESAQNAISIIQKKPILGVGFNAYRYAQIRYGFRGGIGAQTSHADAGTDNSFLFILATTGIMGLVAYLWLWFKIIRERWYFYVRKKNPFSAVALVSIIGVFINSLFINSLFYPFIMLWLWVLITIRENR